MSLKTQPSVFAPQSFRPFPCSLNKKNVSVHSTEISPPHSWCAFEWGNSYIIKQYSNGEKKAEDCQKCTTKLLEQATNSTEIFRLVENLKQVGLVNLIVLNAAIAAFEKCSDGNRALQLLNDMSSYNITPDVVTYSSVISACGKSGNTYLISKILDQMESKGIAPNFVTYSSAIFSYRSNGRREEAWAIYLKMKKDGIQANGSIFSMLAPLCNKLQLKELMHDIFISGITLDAITYSALIMAYGNSGQLKQAEKLYREMGSRGIMPDSILFNAINEFRNPRKHFSENK